MSNASDSGERSYTGRYVTWQVGWESEASTHDVDGTSCVACETTGPLPPGVDAIVMAFRHIDAPADKTEYRLMRPEIAGLLTLCRDATPEEIERARATATAIANGVEEEYKPTAAEKEELAAVRKAAREMAAPVIGAALSVFGNNPLLRTMGNSMVAEWAADQGMRLASTKNDKCTCGAARGEHQGAFLPEPLGCEKTSCKQYRKAP